MLLMTPSDINGMRLATARGAMTSFIDSTVVGGRAYRYGLRAFDLDGNRSEDSNVAEASVLAGVPMPL